MSLTSYRAAPPRDKPFARLCEKTGGETGLANAAAAPIPPSPRLPEKATRGPCGRRVRAVCTNADPLWKGCRAAFFRFYDSHHSQSVPKMASKNRVRMGGLRVASEQAEILEEPPWTSP